MEGDGKYQSYTFDVKARAVQLKDNGLPLETITETLNQERRDQNLKDIPKTTVKRWTTGTGKINIAETCSNKPVGFNPTTVYRRRQPELDEQLHQWYQVQSAASTSGNVTSEAILTEAQAICQRYRDEGNLKYASYAPKMKYVRAWEKRYGVTVVDNHQVSGAERRNRVKNDPPDNDQSTADERLKMKIQQLLDEFGHKDVYDTLMGLMPPGFRSTSSVN
jgi:hypothetical protein